MKQIGKNKVKNIGKVETEVLEGVNVYNYMVDKLMEKHIQEDKNA